MTRAPTTDMAPRRHPRLFAASLRTLVACVVVLVVALAVLVVRLAPVFTSTFGGSRFVTPASTTVHLTAGDWMLYDEVPTSSDDPVGSSGSSSSAPLRAIDVSVTRDGTPLVLHDADGRESITGDDRAPYVAAVSFTVTHEGDYVVDVVGDEGRVRLGRALAASLGDAVPWFVALGLALLGLLVSGALTLGTSGRETSGAVPGPMLPAPAPGWYPDPRGTGAMLWWDGSSWWGGAACQAGDTPTS